MAFAHTIMAFAHTVMTFSAAPNTPPRSNQHPPTPPKKTKESLIPADKPTVEDFKTMHAHPAVLLVSPDPTLTPQLEHLLPSLHLSLVVLPDSRKLAQALDDATGS